MRPLNRRAFRSELDTTLISQLWRGRGQKVLIEEVRCHGTRLSIHHGGAKMASARDDSYLRIATNIAESDKKRVMLIGRDDEVLKTGNQQDWRVTAARVGDRAGLLGDTYAPLGQVGTKILGIESF